MSSKHKHKIRVNPQLRNHNRFINLRQRWLKQTVLNELDCLTTRQFQPVDSLKVLELASVDNTSITDACLYYRTQRHRVPASETVLKALRTVPGDFMEIYVNQILHQQFNDLPAKVLRNFRKLGVVIIDFHDDPYYVLQLIQIS